MKILISLVLPLLILHVIPSTSSSQTYSGSNEYRGTVNDTSGASLGFATVALLHPEDSTLAFFGVTNEDGYFDILRITPGSYLVQVAYLGFRTLYRTVMFPSETGNQAVMLVMKPVPLNLPEVPITAERVPMLFKKDTIEYNAAAFRTKPDAVAEDLIRKLPGIEVDRVGNIKALGEDVRNVLVDGKEFFGSDPKVATKNLPAESVEKVQVYDKKSDRAELTGISDGEHNKTVNLVLKEDRKKAWFGDVKGGAGTGNHYQASAKAYRFSGKSQFAILGMINNINQFGFSFQDYLDFNGGLQSMMSGGNMARIMISSDDGLPVNFGQQVTGLVTSAAGGLNYSYEPRKENRFNISYMGSGTNKDLDETISTENFTPCSSFTQFQSRQENSKNRNHRLNLGWKNKSDSMQTAQVRANVMLVQEKSTSGSATQSYSADTLKNWLDNLTNGNSNRLVANLNGSWMRKGCGSLTLYRFAGDGGYSYSLNRSKWENITTYLGIPDPYAENQYLHTKTDRFTFTGSASALWKTGKSVYLEPELMLGTTYEWVNREQGVPAEPEYKIDSLSPMFERSYWWTRPGLTLKRITKKSQFHITCRMELGRMENDLSGDTDVSSLYLAFVPRISWEYEKKTGKRLTFYYDSYLSSPEASHLLPVVNNINPLSLFFGNRYLKPEYHHDLNISYVLFDNFSFTTLMTSLTGSYIHDKISLAREITDSLGQSSTLVNVPDDYSLSANADFSTPVRKLGLNFHCEIRETWNQGITYIDRVENRSTNWNHSVRLSLDNRKKEKWDATIGVAFDLTNARYSLQEQLNADFFDLAGFTEIRYTPSDRWHFLLSADVTSYNAKSFNEAVSIPLLKAEVDFFFLKNRRAMLSLECFDLLNRNTGIERVSEQNYLREIHSGIIGRYVMLTFKYRINKAGGSGNGIVVRS